MSKEFSAVIQPERGWLRTRVLNPFFSCQGLMSHGIGIFFFFLWLKKTTGRNMLLEHNRPSPAMSTGMEMVLLRVGTVAPSFPCSPPVESQTPKTHN